MRIDKGLGVPQSWDGHLGEDNLLPARGNEPPVLIYIPLIPHRSVLACDVLLLHRISSCPQVDGTYPHVSNLITYWPGLRYPLRPGHLLREQRSSGPPSAELLPSWLVGLWNLATWRPKYRSSGAPNLGSRERRELAEPRVTILEPPPT